MRGRGLLAASMRGADVPEAIRARIEATWALCKATPTVERPRDLASPYRSYPKVHRKCTVCGSRSIVKDGMYFCPDHHPDSANDERQAA